MFSIYSSDNPVSSATFEINSLSYSFIPNLSATNFPIYLPPDAYSLAIVITTCFESLLSVFAIVSLFTTFTFPCFNFLISLIKNIVANMNANPSANGPANKTPCIPNIFPKIIIAGIKKAICLDIESIALIMLFPIAWKNIPDGI